MKTTIKKLVLSAIFSALTCVATLIIKIPSPLKGYINLGDSIVLLSAWLLPLPFGFLSAGIGSALADVFSGYISYAPATFIIKGLMAISAHTIYTLLKRKSNSTLSRIISGIPAEIVMILGYFLFEGGIYGFLPSLINIPANAVQAFAGILIGVVLFAMLEKHNIVKIINS